MQGLPRDARNPDRTDRDGSRQVMGKGLSKRLL